LIARQNAHNGSLSHRSKGAKSMAAQYWTSPAHRLLNSIEDLTVRYRVMEQAQQYAYQLWTVGQRRCNLVTIDFVRTAIADQSA
jgi:hypothetical protein